MGLQSAMEALPEALLARTAASFMEDLSEQHLWADLQQPFCPMWHFCDWRCNWAMTTPLFSSKKYGRAPCHQPDPVRLTSCTWIGKAYVDRARFSQMHALVEHISSRSATCLHKTELERKQNTIYPPKLSLSRKNERERAWELQWRERVVAHTSVGYASSRSETWHHNLVPSWSKRARERDLFSTALSSWKVDVERASVTGESSRKNLNILQAEAEKLSGFTPSIQP